MTMSSVNVVTSCSIEGWKKYGSKFLDTFDKYWPVEVPLHIVSEDNLPLDFRNAPTRFFHKLDSSPTWRLFKSNNAERRWTRGDSGHARPPGLARTWKTNSGYNFRFDAFKFSKKVFAIELVAEQVRTGRLLWLDADTLTHSTVPVELPINLMPSAYAISCLSRVGYHSECGFVGYNLDHQQTLKFIREFSSLYHTGRVFELAEWHDSFVLDWLRNKMLVSTYNIPHKSKGHPFINSELGLYMDHLKGNRKDRGWSLPAERVDNPTIAYWQQGGLRR
jgi:hypothetical protein